MMPPVYPKILIIENELIIAADVSVQLSQLGCEVVGIHARAADALTTIATNRPDIVVLDVDLPGKIDGLMASRILTQTYQVPLILLSARTDREHLQHLLALQPCVIITQPFTDEELHRAVAHILDRQAKAAAGSKLLPGCKLFFCRKTYWLPWFPLDP